MNRVKKFLETFSSKYTAKTYLSGLKSYFQFIYPGMQLEEAAERYFKELRNYEEDVTSYFTEIKGRAPKTVQRLLSTIRTFLIENDVELPEKFWRKLRGRKKGTRALTLDKVPSNVELKKILSHTPIQGKALFLTLASSGMRIGEALSLKLNDIELDKDPAQINIRGEYTKSGNFRVTFISSEAKDAIQEWLKVREQYLQAASGKSHKYAKSSKDDRLFPFEWTTADMIFQNAVRKAGFEEKDSSTNRNKLHIHTLRKFFRSKAATLIPVDIVEALMGHEGYLTEVYRKHSFEDLANFYKKAESSLLVFTNGMEISKLRIEVEERNKQLQTIINGLVAENLELKQRMSEFEKYKELLEMLNNSEVRDAILKLGSSLKKS